MHNEERLFKFNIPPGVCLSKANNGNTKTLCKICPKLTMKSTYKNKTIKVLLLSLSLNLNRFHTLPWCFHCPGVSIAEVNAGWDGLWGAIFECFA